MLQEELGLGGAYSGGDPMTRLTTALAVLLVLAAVGQGNAGIYRVIDLGDLPGGENSSEAFAVSNAGHVVGISDVAGARHAFLWKDGTMIDLSVLEAGHNRSVGYDVNDAGQVAGKSWVDGVGSSTRPFLYDAGVMTNPGSFGGEYGFATGINNAGDIVGLSAYATGATHAFLYSGGVMTDLAPADGYSRAEGINDLRQVAGVSTGRGFLWQDGAMQDLGDLNGGAGHTTAFEINNLTQVIGYSGSTDPLASHPFIWEDGEMEPIGSPSDPSPFGYARGVNNRGQVVGVVTDNPFVWDNVAGMQNLNDLLDESGDGWVLTHAYDINDRGQIVGFGANPEGLTHGFLLTVIPEPSTLIIWSLLGALALTVGWWRRRRAA